MLVKSMVAIVALAMATFGVFFYPEAPRLLTSVSETLSLVN